MSTRVKLHVRSAGNDWTGDGSLANPFKTTNRALLAIPRVDLDGTFRYVVDSDYVETDPVNFPAFQSGQQITFTVSPGGIDFTPFYQEGYVTLQAVPTTLDTLSTPDTSYAYDSLSSLAKVTDSSKAWTPDAFKGKFLVGSGVAEIAEIAGNTADTLDTTAFYPFTAPLQIVDCGAALNGGVNLSAVGAPIVINGLKMVMSGANDRSLTMLGCSSVSAVMVDVQNPDARQSQTISINGYVHGNGGSITGLVCSAQGYTLFGYIKNCVPATTGPNFGAFQCIVEDTPLLDSGLYGVTPWGQIMMCEWRGRPFRYRGGQGVFVQNLKVSGVTGDGIVADGPGILELNANVGVDTATVTGLGLFVDNAAQVKVTNTGSVQPIGTGGALKVGTLATLPTWGTYTGNECDDNRGGARVFT